MLNDELHENWVQWLNKLTFLVHAFICCKWCFFFFHTGRCPTSAFTMLTARVHVDVCICVWKSPIWKQLLAVRALRHPQCLSLWPKRNVSPSPFFLSVSPSLSFFATSLFLYLFLFPLFPHWIKLLSYESQQKGKVKPLSISFIYLFIFIGNNSSPPLSLQPYFNSNHTLPICANKPWKYQH